ncbi:response regulator [Pseudoluteimonas lycopersici]|uniref:Chemotaxis protein CheA n=1 Tax=Pseudoluteimonas lycopersici TaxID=1324796 RepID=A0A516V7S3_9GAMM|nr:Hpt domain-containing protein [Lysobacter lycopersici]QDQ74589.1 response regulator [Lysobacter lycopersici]
MTTALRDAIDFTALGWIKPELDETLRQARLEIEAYAEDPGDAGRMRACATLLHQVQGSLRMLELYAPAMVGEEMETLATTLADGNARNRDEASAALMRGVVLLPDYLERLQGGHRDIPIVLLPLLNELRAARGAPGLNESVLFAPDLHRPLPAAASNVATDDAAQAQLAKFSDALAQWPETGAPADVNVLANAAEGLIGHARDEATQRMLWVAASMAHAMQAGAVLPGAGLRQAFGGVEREARHQFDGNDLRLGRADAVLEPTRQLLYHAAQAGEHPALQELRRTFDLDAPAPTAEELEHARGSVSGRNRALLDTVAAALKEDLLRVKDALDLHLRTGDRDVAGLQPQVESLGRISDTLGMLGLGNARHLVAEQESALHAIVGGERPAEEGALLDIAGALLFVDASLDDQVARLGTEAGAEDVIAGESRKVLEVLVREAVANFADARQAFVAFVETNWDHAQLSEVPRLLQEVEGALRILELPLPADYLVGIRRFTQSELIARHRVPNGRQLDTLADALASLEYYLEALREQRPHRDDILEIAHGSLESLGYWPLPPEAPAPVEAMHEAPDAGIAEVETQLQSSAPAAAATEVPVEPAAPAATRPAPSAAAAAVGGFDTTSDEIDDEIREVFLEEFEEEIRNLDGMLPPWRAAPDDLEKLRPIRRVFHTLKGSGRLVGAKALGEFSWKVEGMLNRVLDASRPASPAVVAMVDQAFYTLPQLHAALRGEGGISADLAGMEAVADRIAAGEDVFYSAQQAATPVEAPVEQAPAAIEAVAEVAAPVAEEGVPANVDPVLLEILDAEVLGHLATVENWLQDAGDAAPASDALLRAVHTMNGAFAMTEVPAITEAVTPAEAYLKRALAAKAVIGGEGIAALAALATAVQGTVAGLKQPEPRVSRQGELAARFTALRDALPEPPPPGEHEHELPSGAMTLEPIDSYPQAESDRIAAEQAEAEAAHLEVERIAAEKAEAERVEAERLAAEQSEVERLAAEQSEVERLEAARIAAEKAEAERLETERAAAEQAEAERLEAERTAAEKAEAERVEAERIAAEKAEAERLAAEKAEADRVAAEEAEYARIEAEYAAQAAAEKAEAERVEAERIAAEKAEAERIAAEQAEAERLAAEKAEAERVAAERAEAERITAERVEAERIAAERRAEEERAAAERREAERAAIAKARELEALATLQATTASGEDPDEALDLTDLDPELVDIFTEESGDLLDHSDGLLAQLRENPHERELLVGLQRDLHTLKGGARMAGVMAVGELGHAMESLLEAAVEHRAELGGDGVPLLERGFDRLHAMVTRVNARRAIGMPEGLIAEFNARARGEDVAAAIAGASVQERKVVELKPLSAPMAAAAEFEDDDAAVRAPQEQVRIRADLLDRLVNYAGEVAIYRARLEQQLGAFRSAMVEMEQTNTRLRDQLRRLDSETEAQIIARYQREHENEDQSFDPLELDRFSTLQQLSRALAESAADMSSLQGTLDDLTRQYETLLLQQSRVSSELQEGLMRTRMLPFDSLVPRLRRVVRQAAAETGKQVQLRLDGAQGELDRSVLEHMTAPLEHMLRNAVAHGIESPAARKSARKPEEGAIAIAMRREGSEVVLEIRDDGAGLNRDAIRSRAVERGLIRDDAVLAESDLDALIMEPGFSTAETVSRLAGRGVGMDVVASEVRQLGGSLDIRSKSGEGTAFTLRLPQTLAVTQAVFVRIGDTTYAVPIASVRGVGRISRDELGASDASYRYGGEEYPVHDLGSLLGHAPAKAEGQLQMPLLLVRAGDLRAAVLVDQVVGNREIVVKPVGPQVASLPGIFGATIMGDGRVVVILDVAPLVRRQAVLPRETEPRAEIAQRRVPLVMVVDDSVTMRKVTGRVLERHNIEVGTAKDGIDALERMAERVPDLMLLDIEMPRMDGYELATAMRADPRLRDVPIIMITSRTGEKHRQRALEIGVQRYLGKPYQEPELMRNVFELLAEQMAEWGSPQ